VGGGREGGARELREFIKVLHGMPKRRGSAKGLSTKEVLIRRGTHVPAFDKFSVTL